MMFEPPDVVTLQVFVGLGWSFLIISCIWCWCIMVDRDEIEQKHKTLQVEFEVKTAELTIENRQLKSQVATLESTLRLVPDAETVYGVVILADLP